MLDLQSVRLFVLAVDVGNLSRAAEAAGTVQPVVSQRIRSLERMLRRRLLDRTPRFVRTTADGAAFLVHARQLLAAHEAAIGFADAPSERFAIAASDHAVGAELETLIRAVRSALPARSVLEVRLGLSQQMRALYDAGEADVAILRREAGGNEGEVVGLDPLGWRAREGLAVSKELPLPLVTLGPPCAVRATAIRVLEQAGRQWIETFVGGGCAALIAAVSAGVGVAPMGAVASGRLPDVGAAFALPMLPASEIVLLARASSPSSSAGIRAVDRTLRQLLRG